MKKCSGAPLRRAGIRLFVGLGMTAAMLLLCPGTALATKAEKVTLEEDSGTPPTPSEEPKADESSEPQKVKRVVPPYSLPWQLRPVLPVSMVRSDTSFAFYGVDGASIVSFLSGSYKLIPQIAIFGKLGIAEDSPPTGAGGVIFVNPLLGGQIGFWPAKSIKLGLTLGLTIPVGGGGTSSEDPGAKLVNRAAMLARGGFDNALFMPDYLGILPGVDIALVTRKFTVQAELNLAFLTKVRGVQQEKSSNNDFSMGLHVGYFFFPFLSAGLDLRYQHWLSTPRFVFDDPSRASRDNFTIGVGPRFHAKLGDGLWLRPGLSLSFGLDDPIAGSHYKTVQLDLPFYF